MKIGSFGQRRERELLTFDWYGQEFRAHPGFGLVTLTDLMEQFGGMLDTESAAAMALGLKQMFRSIVHPDEFDIFWSLCREVDPDPEEFIALMQALVEAKSDRPTERSSGSSDGPDPSVDGSKVAFLRQASGGRPEIEAGLIETALERGELKVV